MKSKINEKEHDQMRSPCVNYYYDSNRLGGGVQVRISKLTLSMLKDKGTLLLVLMIHRCLWDLEIHMLV